MSEEQLVEYRVDGAVATLRMNRPQVLNAFTPGLRRALIDAFDRAERDPAIKVIVFGSTGRGFSAGADLTEPKSDTNSGVDERLQGYRPLLEKIARSPWPVIGVAPGVAAGVGVALGGRRADVVRMVVSQGAKRAVFGLVAGLGLAFAMGGAMSEILVGVSPTDPAVFGGVTLMLAVVSFVGLYLPARRVSQTDPVQALSAE